MVPSAAKLMFEMFENFPDLDLIKEVEQVRVRKRERLP